MMCNWKELLSILPPGIREQVDSQGRDSLQELRLRCGLPPELVVEGKGIWLKEKSSREDLHFVINAASRYSPWAAATSASGYLTAPGGHRIGICGEVVYHNGIVEGIREVDSLCIRVSRDLQGIGRKAAVKDGSLLIIGPPGWGKTTLLRDVIRSLSEYEHISVVDERGELFPKGFSRGKQTDVLLGCPKHLGIDMVLRTMGPSCIAVDEITAQQDCQALTEAANCGVRLLATAHAASKQEFERRTVYRPLVEAGIFDTLVILRQDKSYHVERMTL